MPRNISIVVTKDEDIAKKEKDLELQALFASRKNMTEINKDDLEKYVSNDLQFVELFKKLSIETQIKD